MANTRHHPILDYLRRVLGEGSGGGVSDADLLRRFVDQRDEAAFELLLWRHAAMVLHVCRQVLGDADAAEDAFQGTFLVFVRKANSISRREALGSWLYRVAYRIALKAQARARARTATPQELDCLAAPTETEDAGQRELRRIICEEVNRLPADYRAAVVACFFEGKTHEEAAKQLGWPRGTVAGRLARARELLRRRLVRRGVTLTLSALLTALAARTAQAALTGLVDSVIHTARLVAAGQAAAAVVSPQVAALAEGVLQTMYWTKAKIAVVVLFLASLGGAGVTLLATQEQKQPAVLETGKRKAETTPQEEKARTEAMKKPPVPVETNAEDRIRPGDLLDIHVGGIPPEAGPIQQRVFQVEANGKIALGLGYGRVDIKRLTLEEAEERIHKHLENKLKGSVAVSVTRPIPDNPRLQRLVQQLKEEHAQMQVELKKLRDEIEALKRDISKPR